MSVVDTINFNYVCKVASNMHTITMGELEYTYRQKQNVNEQNV